MKISMQVKLKMKIDWPEIVDLLHHSKICCLLEIEQPLNPLFLTTLITPIFILKVIFQSSKKTQI